jgi:hypothetical protein
MMTSAFKNRLLLAALLSLLGFLPPHLAAVDVSCGSVDRFVVALRFAEALFPELKDKELNISLSHGTGGFIDSASEMDDLQVRFDKPTWHAPGETNEKSGAELVATMEKGGVRLPLTLYLSFIKLYPPTLPRLLTCHPVQFTSDAGQEQMRKVQEAIDPHPEWSDARELEEARKLGLRYGPEDKNAVLRLIPLRELKQYYGPLKIKSAEFSVNGGGKCAGCSFVLPWWDIKLSGGGPHGLSIIIEPFFGRITHLSSGE